MVSAPRDPAAGREAKPLGQQNPPRIKAITNGNRAAMSDKEHATDDTRTQMPTERPTVVTRSVSIITTPRRQRAPAVDFSLSPQPPVHHILVLDSPVPPVPVHELPRILSAVSIQSTADDESARTPNIRSLLKFRQQPGPRTKGVAEAPRWIPRLTATPPRNAPAHSRIEAGGPCSAPTREETRHGFGLKSVTQIL